MNTLVFALSYLAGAGVLLAIVMNFVKRDFKF